MRTPSKLAVLCVFALSVAWVARYDHRRRALLAVESASLRDALKFAFAQNFDGSDGGRYSNSDVDAVVPQFANAAVPSDQSAIIPVNAESPGAGEPALRTLAEAQGRWIGTAAAVKPLQNDPSYSQFLGSQFDVVTPENAMKFAVLHPRAGFGPGSYDFSQGDAIVSFANAHGMRVRGHTLVWHNQVPDWVTSGNYAPSDLSAILENHIRTVVGHYQGKLYSWDVVNEAVNPDGTMRQTLWSSIGPNYIADAFRWAHAADPNAKLFYNDFGAEASPAKADAIYQLVASLRAQGVPIAGVGLQFHMTAGQNYGDFSALLHRFAELGVELHVTEIDVNTGNPETPAQSQQQAMLYGQVLSACLAEPACKAYVMWGFSDKYAWRAPLFPDILDANFHAKPAFDVLLQILTAINPGKPK